MNICLKNIEYNKNNNTEIVKILKIEAVMALINLTDKINNSPKKTIVKHCHTLNATNSSRPFHKK